MKMKLLTAIAVLAMAGVASAGLINGGFETGDTTGWDTTAGNGAAVSTDYAHSGTYSLAIDSTGTGAWSSPNVFQAFEATEGDVASMDGWMLTAVAAQASSWATIKLEWKDINGNNIEPGAGVTSGAIDGTGQSYVGVVGSPQVNSTSAVDTWVFTDLQATAPAGTVAANFYLLNVNGNPGDTFYFDDVTAAVPEPATMGLLALSGGFMMLIRRFRFKV